MAGSKPKSWRCFWCDVVFTDPAKAEIHFGAPHSSRDAPDCIRQLRAENEQLKADFQTIKSVYDYAKLENEITRLCAENEQIKAEMKIGADRLEIAAGACREWSDRLRVLV